MCYKLIRRIEDFHKEVQELDNVNPLFCDTETCTEEGKSNGGLYGAIRLFQFYQTGMKYALIIDCRFVPLYEVLDYVKSFHLIFHNASYDLHTINNSTDEVWLPRRLDDTIYLSRLTLWERGSKFGFYECLQYAGLEDDTIRSIDKKENQKADWGGVLTPTMLKYAAYDVLYLSLLWNKVHKARLTESYKLDMFNLKYAIEYSRRGIPTDQKKVKEKLLESTEELEEILLKLPVNPNSSKQVCKYLGSSKSDHDTLVKLKLEGNKEAGLVSDARSLTKRVGFLKKYDRPIVKGYYNPSSAISGRWSCTGGDVFDHSNLQQIPKDLLECLLALAGKVFVYKDYAGLELRMAVAWIAEPTMERMIREGVDLHSYTASVLFNVPMDQLTKKQRTIGKICNFLLIYGGGIARLQASARAWGGIVLSFQEAKEIRLAWLKEYNYFNEWHSMTRRHMEVYGYLDVETALGRQVRCTNVNDALNIPVQGSSSEVTKMSLKYLKERYEDEYLVSTIHDSATIMVDEDAADLWGRRLNECMIDGWKYVVGKTAIPDLPMDEGVDIHKRWIF